MDGRATLGRRAFLSGLASALGVSVGACALMGSAHAATSFELKRLEVKGKHATRFDLLVPKHLSKGAPLGLLVALHGLGESFEEELGAAAWVDRYGLGSSYERLLAAPIARTSKRGEWTDARLDEVNASLKARPFAGLAVACPFTPNFKGVADRAAAVAEYARWIVEGVLPLAREKAGASSERALTSIDGCSMGGPLALDAFLAHPATFGRLGVVQGAFGEHRAAGYAAALAKASEAHGAASIQLLSSSGDSFVDSARALHRELAKRSVNATLRVLPGPHDQPWLREAGTIEMLLFHERG